MSEESLKCADIAIEIPQFGTKHSFNVTVSMGIVLWDHFYKTTRAHKGIAALPQIKFQLQKQDLHL